jgi:hypothetical protein
MAAQILCFPIHWNLYDRPFLHLRRIVVKAREFLPKLPFLRGMVSKYCQDFTLYHHSVDIVFTTKETLFRSKSKF